MLGSATRIFKKLPGSSGAFRRRVYHLTGVRPKTVAHYRLAFRHSSLSNSRCNVDCNERLEFLGDAILGAVVSEYLYKRYPSANEGWLTEMRAKIVRRKSLNHLGEVLGLQHFLQYNKRHNGYHPSMLGNCLEALVGAVYLDRGLPGARQFVLGRLLSEYLDLAELENKNENYKSQLMEFAQKRKLPRITYELVAERQESDSKRFFVVAKLGDQVIGRGNDIRKKAAEQHASQMALRHLSVLEPVSSALEPLSAN